MSNESEASETSLAATLLKLELLLMDPMIRRDQTKVSIHFAEGFREFGSSGRAWSREEILARLEEEPAFTRPTVENFKVVNLAEGVALATYKTRREAGEGGPFATTSLRSSVWVLRGQAWQILFHQGTKVPNADPE